MKCTITVEDEVWCYISGLMPAHIEFLWDKLGIFTEGYFFAPAFKMGRWDGKVRFFQKTGKTYVRLLHEVVPYLEAWKYTIDIVDKRSFHAQPDMSRAKILKFDADGIAIEAEGCDVFGGARDSKGRKIELRPYQLQCLMRAVEEGSGSLSVSTGGGKSLITAAISKVYSDVGHRVITVVPSDDLVKQTAAWYRAVGLDTGVYSGSEKDVHHQCVVATWQSVQNNADMIMSLFTCFIFDELQGAKATVAQKILNESGKHIPFRFGVTGTIPKPKVDQTTIFSSVGPVIHEVKAKWLIDNGFLAKINIQPIEIDETYIDEDFPDYSSEIAFLSKSTPRLEKIADLIISHCATYGNTMVLVNSNPFGKKLASLIKGAVFLYCESPSDLRKEHYDMFEEHDDLIVIASAGIAAAGISIDRIFALILIDPKKSFVKAIQSIGRGLRLGRDKDKVMVLDVHSKLRWAKKHWKSRLVYYKEAEYPVLPVQKLRVKDNS